MLLQDAAQAEELAVGSGELSFEFAHRGVSGGTFLAELRGEDVHDVAVCIVPGGSAARSGRGRGLLGA